MLTLSHLHIAHPFIALFGSGNSIHHITDEDFERIKAHAFVITLNYAPLRLKGHLNMWSDRQVSEFFENHYASQPKDCLFLAQEGRVGEKLKGKVDYWFNRQKENLHGNYTIVWALQLLKKYFPDKKILLFGVDLYADGNNQAKWYDQFTDYDKSRRGVNYQAEQKLQQCGSEIAQFVRKENVYNCNPDSRLQHFEKKDWRDLFRFRILHLCPSALAGAPVHLSNILNKYTYCESKTILGKAFSGNNLQNLKWDYDIITPSKKQLEESIDWADLIHYHRSIYPHLIPNKPSVLQFHTPPAGYVPEKTFAEFNGRKLVIAQYHPRYYTDALVVPNMIDIWEERFLPGEKPADKVNIFYSWASEIKNSWGDKGSAATIAILKKIQSAYGKRVDIEVWNNRPYEACMAAKRKAHICIDECITGSYHLQSLEGCSIGAVTFNNLDDTTHSFLQTVSGSTSHPFVKSNLDGLLNVLDFYINNKAELHKKGLEARKWMEEYWDPRKLVFKYVDAYFNVLLNNKVFSGRNQKPLNGMDLKTGATPTNMQKPFISTTKSQSLNVDTQSPKNQALNNSPQPGRSIKELYKKYEGQDIYIFGTGPSLFDINPEDYKDKICFGVNYSFEVILDMDYIFVHVIETYNIIKKVVDNKKLLLPETLVRQHYTDPAKNMLPNRLRTDNELAYIYPVQDPSEKTLDKKTLKLDPGSSIFTWSTTTHSAIHIAAYMGAKNIYLIGVDYKTFKNGRVHFDSKYDPKYARQDWNALKKHKLGDLWLEKELKNIGVNLINLGNEPDNALFLSELRLNKPSIFSTQTISSTLGTRMDIATEKAGIGFLSICLTVQNRSKFLLSNGQYCNLLPNCLASVAASVKHLQNVEIVISDFNSTDWPLGEWIDEVLKGVDYKIIESDSGFNRGAGRNMAADHAKGDILFFLDADMLVTKEVIEIGMDMVRQGIVFYPMCFYFLNPEHSQGFWCEGKGNVFMSKDIYLASGKWPSPPYFQNELYEDVHYYNVIKDSGATLKDTKIAGFFHQYHQGWSVDTILKKYKHLILPTNNNFDFYNGGTPVSVSHPKDAETVRLPGSVIQVMVNNTKFGVLEHHFYNYHKVLKWEMYTYLIFKKYLRKDRSYIDIGAWIGPTILYAWEIGVKSIYGVEPNPNSFEMLKYNCKINNISAKLERLCILDNKGWTKLGYDNNDPYSDMTSIKGDLWKTPTISLSQYLERYCENDWDLIKIDIEGAETFIWDDLKRLSERKSSVILLSLHPPFWEDKRHTLKALCEAISGFKLMNRNLQPLTLNTLKNMIMTDIGKPDWGTESGNFFEILLESNC